MVIVYANGQWVNENDAVIPVDERGHQFGDGVYEVTRIYEGKPFMMREHVERLVKSAEAIRMDLGMTVEEIESLMMEAVERSGEKNCDVYIQITRGIAKRGHLFPKDVKPSITMTVRPMEVIAMEERLAGKTAIFHEDERWKNCYIKSLNLLPNILAKQVANDAGAYEAILIRDGYVTEGTSSNIFIVQNGELVTRPLSNYILAGITRMRVEQLAEQLNIPFVEREFTKEDVLEAEEVFMTSTTNEVLPLVEIDGTTIGSGVAGPVTERVAKQFLQTV
ncbi:D-amino-acid transaminase [Savagea sp. SN6]|uniref:D-alanine aminotransferase n=1 Tax=Savagea serpentis TaxID=2785297 RepID=A0A8J7GKC9_9BACL|nr:D-amino-acid transaminase [Savagea serpentis]MBF4501590.1 D-amino-acid transaminase [Savagea serpentis]